MRSSALQCVAVSQDKTHTYVASQYERLRPNLASSYSQYARKKCNRQTAHSMHLRAKWVNGGQAPPRLHQAIVLWVRVVVYIHIYICVYIYVCIYVYIYIHIYIYIYIHTHMCVDQTLAE